jgi:hypothetical protein
MDRHPHQLLIPPLAANDRGAVEVLRVWSAGGNQHVSINHLIWEDPAVCGIMLVDLARHVARAFDQSGAMDERQVLSRIKKLFDAEWSSPTDAPRGGLT